MDAQRAGDESRGTEGRRAGTRRTRAAALAAACLVAALSVSGWAPAASAEPGLGRFWVAAEELADASPAERSAHAARNRVDAAKLVLALAGAGLLGWGAWRGRRGGGPSRMRDVLLAGLGLASFFGWWNFFHFHYPAYPHAHELFHYTLGAKYFPELGYQRLYVCTAVADVQDGLRARVAARRITDLESYELVGTAEILSAPERCTGRFSAERWELFRHDVRFFRERMTPERWERLQRDHGYNPTPVWALLGVPLAGSGPIDEARLATLTLIDPLLTLLLWGYAIWGFGWRAACVALIYWGTNQPADFSWTGGAFLRQDWLAASVVGLALLRKGRPALAGFLLGYAALLRIFPVLLWLPLLTQALESMWRRRSWRPARVHRRLAAGGLLALVGLVPLATALSGGPGVWGAFARNAALHASTPTSNGLGLRTLVGYEPSAREALLETRAADPSRAWKQARRAALSRRWPLLVMLAAGFVALVGFAARRQDPWVAAILGVGLVPVLLEPSSYYTSLLLAYGFLWTRRPEIGAALCGLSAAGWLAAAGFERWDDIALWTSVASLLFAAFATLRMLRPPFPRARVC